MSNWLKIFLSFFFSVMGLVAFIFLFTETCRFVLVRWAGLGSDVGLVITLILLLLAGSALAATAMNGRED